jgi:hypothetical protein
MQYRSRNIILYVSVLGIWLVTLLIKLKYNGLVFGFDYGLYHPDGALYTTRALDWSGYTETEAAKIVSNWYNIHAFKFNNTNLQISIIQYTLCIQNILPEFCILCYQSRLLSY